MRNDILPWDLVLKEGIFKMPSLELLNEWSWKKGENINQFSNMDGRSFESDLLINTQLSIETLS